MSDRPGGRQQKQREDEEGRSVSEGGSGSLNAETARGGADSVPDTPDVNTEINDAVDTSRPSDSSTPSGSGTPSDRASGTGRSGNARGYENEPEAHRPD